MPIDSSKFFDSIRIKPNKLSAKQQAAAREASAMCEWPDCKNKGPHRAPKGRANDKEYWHFCLNHVREYNQSYNFFSGMNDEDLRERLGLLCALGPEIVLSPDFSDVSGRVAIYRDLNAACLRLAPSELAELLAVAELDPPVTLQEMQIALRRVQSLDTLKLLASGL